MRMKSVSIKYFRGYKDETRVNINDLTAFVGKNDIGKSAIPYLRENRNGTVVQEDKILTEYIRHQIHHPENIRNVRYTNAQLKESTKLMRDFIVAQSAAV